MTFDSAIPPNERYRIIGRIAAGGMAEIYLARMLTNAGVEREVVLKRLMPELQADAEFVHMFYDEARIASQMRHPNIVQIIELGELDGSLFISMELLRGVNLRDMLARLHTRKERIPVHLAVRIACGALEALAYAHRFTDPSGRLLNVVHRDVSPQNILVTFDGTVKLVDFGVAKAEGRLHQTRAGLIKGKFAYMSPEQIGGGRVDGRSDIFALAEVFYELMLRRHPFFAPSDMEVLRAILDVDPPHPSSVDQAFPSDLGAILIKAMRKNPGDRYANASAMHDALEKFLVDQRTPSTATMLGRFVRELFADRVENEQRAREQGDEDLLIRAMMSGRAESAPPQQRRTSRARQSVDIRIDEPESDSDSDVVNGPRTLSERNAIVEVSHTEESMDPAEDEPEFIAHSGFTDPGVRKKYFQTQVARLFDEGSSPDVLSLGTGERPNSNEHSTDPNVSAHGIDDGEMPTIMGNFDVEQLAAIRARNKNTPTNLQVERERPVSREDIEVANAATAEGPIRRPIDLPEERVSGRKPRISEARRREGSTSDLSQREAKTDRLGLLLFVAGLGALLGAIVYAIMLYSSTAAVPVMRLVVSSTPPGATIYLNGTNTGVATPQSFQNIPSDREHLLELRLDGYKPYTHRLPPSPELVYKLVEAPLNPISKPARP